MTSKIVGVESPFRGPIVLVLVLVLVLEKSCSLGSRDEDEDEEDEKWEGERLAGIGRRAARIFSEPTFNVQLSTFNVQR